MPIAAAPSRKLVCSRLGRSPDGAEFRPRDVEVLGRNPCDLIRGRHHKTSVTRATDNLQRLNEDRAPVFDHLLELVSC